MSLRNDLSIKKVIYNGIEIPIVGGKKESKVILTVSSNTSGNSVQVSTSDTEYDMSNVVEEFNVGTKEIQTANSYINIKYKAQLGASFSVSSGDIQYIGKSGSFGTYTYCFMINGDGSITGHVSCFLPDTLITLSNRSKKAIKDLTYDDELLVWDFDKGEFGTSSICWLTTSGLNNDHYYKLTFSDGTILKTTGQNSNHKVYNVDERYFKGVDKTQIGDRIFSENGIVTVTAKEYIEEEVEYYNLITTDNINCFAEGILTSDRYGNMYPIDENMKYIKEGRTVRSYDDYELIGIKKYWYDTLRLGEVDETLKKTKDYIAKLECQMRDLDRVDAYE